MRHAWPSFVAGLTLSLALIGLPVLSAWAGPAPAPAPAAARPCGDHRRLAERVTLAARATIAALDRVSYRDAGAPTYRWNDLTARHLLGTPGDVRGRPVAAGGAGDPAQPRDRLRGDWRAP